MPAPLISVLMPVRDGERYLGAALASLAQQSLGDFEVIVVDDGSVDGTAAMLAAAAARDPRLRIDRQAGQGVSAALNRALALAQGRFLARLDADDIARPERFAAQAAYLETHPRVAAVGGGYEEIDQDDRPLRAVRPPTEPARIRAILPRTNCIAHPTVMMRRDAILAVGGYRPAFDGAEDYDLWLRLLERWDLANLPELLLGYRRHPHAATLRRVRDSAFAELAARTAFERRSRGLGELVEETRPVDRALLLRMGVAGRDIDRHLLKRLMAAARVAARTGAGDQARRLVEEASALVMPRGDLWARIDFLWRRRKVWR